ncbi:hypothetical protein [Sorangium sp. So ce1389]|uniref:hypothetical protein n=1 Tax=Sorangium sp. So ce1389 TaxID=3133336 RepID=UPI003F62E484
MARQYPRGGPRYIFWRSQRVKGFAPKAETLAAFEGTSYVAALRAGAVFLKHEFWTPNALGF